MSDEAVALEMGVTSQAVDALLKKAIKNLSVGVGIADLRAMTILRGKETVRFGGGGWRSAKNLQLRIK